MNANGYTDESLAHGAQMQERKSEEEKTGQDGDLFHQSIYKCKYTLEILGNNGATSNNMKYKLCKC